MTPGTAIVAYYCCFTDLQHVGNLNLTLGVFYMLIVARDLLVFICHKKNISACSTVLAYFLAVVSEYKALVSAPVSIGVRMN